MLCALALVPADAYNVGDYRVAGWDLPTCLLHEGRYLFCLAVAGLGARGVGLAAGRCWNCRLGSPSALRQRDLFRGWKTAECYYLQLNVWEFLF